MTANPVAHRLAKRMPPMRGEDFAQLRADMEQHGQRVPIVLYDGAILDGVHRYRACTELGLTPITQRFTGTDTEALAYVISLNVHRRHLTVDMRAALGVEEMLAEERARAAERRRENEGRPKTGADISASFPEAVETVASTVGVGKDKVRAAEQLQQADPERFQQVAAGEKSLARATDEVKQEQAAANPDYANALKTKAEADALSRFVGRVRALANADLDEARPALERVSRADAESHLDWVRQAQTVLERFDNTLTASSRIRRIG